MGRAAFEITGFVPKTGGAFASPPVNSGNSLGTAAMLCAAVPWDSWVCGPHPNPTRPAALGFICYGLGSSRAEPVTYSTPSASIVPGGIQKTVDAYKISSVLAVVIPDVS